jgi:hypothetical protein
VSASCTEEPNTLIQIWYIRDVQRPAYRQRDPPYRSAAWYLFEKSISPICNDSHTLSVCAAFVTGVNRWRWHAVLSPAAEQRKAQRVTRLAVVRRWCNCGRVQLKCDGTRWSTGGEVKGKLANGVGSQYPSHHLGTWCIQHYYRWCAHLGCRKSTELTPPPI